MPPLLKGVLQPTPLPRTVAVPCGTGPCYPCPPGEPSGSAHPTCKLDTAGVAFLPPISSSDGRALKTQMDNVSNTTRS